MKNIGLMTIVVIGLLFNSLVYADLIYTNDFGTQAQIDEWSAVNVSKDWEPTDKYTGPDLDGDGNSQAMWVQARSGYAEHSTYQKIVSGSQPMNIENVAFTGTADASNWATHVSMRMSYDGNNWTDWETINDGSYMPDSGNEKLVDVSGDPNYQGINQVYLQIKLDSNSGAQQDGPWRGPTISYVKLNGTIVPEPATIGLLVFGALGFIRRK